jgi:protein-disulfide isomerase
MSSSDNKNTPKLIGVILLILAIAAAGYYFLAGKSDYGAETVAPVATEQTEPTQSEEAVIPTETETEPTPVVVETKTLNLPAANAPEIPMGDSVSSPEVEKMMGVRKIGSDDAPIKVVEYSSLTCGHCASFHKNDLPVIKTDYIDTGKVQIIFKEFPLNKPAIDASKILRCMPEEKFNAFQSLLLDEQEKWAYTPEYLEPLKQNAKLAGLSEDQIESCLNNKELETRILGDMKAASDKFNIQSTPTFIVNDGVKVIVGHQGLPLFKETFDGILNGTIPNVVPPVVEETKE